MYLCSHMEEIMNIKSMPTVQIIQALGKRFREYRIAARMTQKEVAGPLLMESLIFSLNFLSRRMHWPDKRQTSQKE